MIPPWISSAKDLVTSRQATREGFLKQALIKTDRATPFVRDAERLLSVLDKAASYGDLAASRDPWVQDSLLSAAGFSDKAKAHLSDRDLELALSEALAEISRRATDSWQHEIVYRFLLTRGDTLGGIMRNVIGALGAVQLASAIVEALAQKRPPARLEKSAGNAGKITSISWEDRLLVFDRKPHFVDKNVDAVLYDTRSESVVRGRGSRSHPRCLACGELKGGIDPAGADEHWKTAATALQRIREGCSSQDLPVPATFFVAAAIEQAMAEEIFAQLEKGLLDCAANLTAPEQLSGLVSWLIAL